MTSRVWGLRIYPIKGLCGVSVSEVDADESLSLSFDRKWALFDERGQYINGKTCPSIHMLRLKEFSAPATVKVALSEEPPVVFDLSVPQQLRAAGLWFSAALRKKAVLRLSPQREGGWSDDPRFEGPTVVSLASLEAVRSWFPGVAPSVEQMADRFRPNLIVDGVPAFWEDSLLAPTPQHAIPFAVGGVPLLAVHPVHRCVVPTRAPSSSSTPGEVTPAFIRTFTERREASFPAGAPVGRLTAAADPQRSYFFCTAAVFLHPGPLHLGDAVAVGESVDMASCLQKHRPPLSSRALRSFFHRAYAIRAIPKGLFLVASFASFVLPANLAAFLLINKIPAAVRKPTKGQALFSLLLFLVVVCSIAFLLWLYLFRNFYS